MAEPIIIRTLKIISQKFAKILKQLEVQGKCKSFGKQHCWNQKKFWKEFKIWELMKKVFTNFKKW